MKRISAFVLLTVLSLVWQWFILFRPMAYAGDSLGETIDCTDVRVDYVDDPSLTQKERLRLMDEAFRRSLEKFEFCQSAKKMTGASDGPAENDDGAKGGSGNSAGQTGGTSAQDSVASSTMSGTQPPQKTPPFGEGAPAADDLPGSLNKEDKTDVETAGGMNKSNGKRPEDIPPARNDDALAAQIRYAAENETDPVKKKQLWNEYRKYKGLPTQ